MAIWDIPLTSKADVREKMTGRRKPMVTWENSLRGDPFGKLQEQKYIERRMREVYPDKSKS